MPMQPSKKPTSESVMKYQKLSPEAKERVLSEGKKLQDERVTRDTMLEVRRARLKRLLEVYNQTPAAQRPAKIRYCPKVALLTLGTATSQQSDLPAHTWQHSQEKPNRSEGRNGSKNLQTRQGK